MVHPQYDILCSYLKDWFSSIFVEKFYYVLSSFFLKEVFRVTSIIDTTKRGKDGGREEAVSGP